MSFHSSCAHPFREKENKRLMPREEEVSLMIYLKKEVEAALLRNDSLEKENQELRQEIARLRAQISSLKAYDNERKSMLWKKIQNSNDTSKTEIYPQKLSDSAKVSDQPAGHLNLRPNIQDLPAKKESFLQVPIPPSSRPSAISPVHKQLQEKLPATTGPPPPPPLPTKMLNGSKSVRRVPEVIEFYRFLTRKSAQKDNRANSSEIPVVTLTSNMIGEIENRSSYLSAIKSDVEKQKEFVNILIQEVGSAAFKDIYDVETFVKWLDNELSSLIDERAVLKHFPQWPERKADALREAACNYRDLKKLESEVSSFEDNLKDPLTMSLEKMQALQNRLERSASNVERTREVTIKRYKDFQIPWEWLLNSGLVGQMKLSSLRLAKQYMKRITKELQLSEQLGEENQLLQGARFAYRVHQFAGGFDADTIRAFEELKNVAMTAPKQ